jgi:hypothetical protein
MPRLTNLKTIVTLLIGLTLLVGCGKEQFSIKKKVESQNTNPVSLNTSSSCSSFTLIKPKVDFLFLWDNSSSSIFINDSTKAALNNTIDLVSSRFDYHIMLAPLVLPSPNTNDYAKFISDTPDGLTQSALNMKIDRSQAASALNTFPGGIGSVEAGLSRASWLISNNISNGIFRPNSYLIIVVMSNQDDTSYPNAPISGADREIHIQNKSKELLCLRGNYSSSCSGPSLNSQQMRFISLVGHSSCSSAGVASANYVYKKVSEIVYSSSYTNGNPSASGASYPYDSYNLCSQSNFVHLFDGVNNSIQDTLIKHKYNYWPLASTGAAAIDPDEVRVYKDGVEMNRLTEPVGGGSNGFSFTNGIQAVNTRYEPTPGEPFTGYVVKLYGNARVTYPECMTIKTQSPKEFYGFVHLQTKPVESTINLKINGQTVPQSTTNGWQLLKSGGAPQYFASKNIKIAAPGNYSDGYPAVMKSGYFLQVYGTAIYSNGSSIEVYYDPSN